MEAERADRGSDRCSGPEEARTCDRLTLTRPFSGRKKKRKEKKKEKKQGCHGNRRRLREKMGWESSLLRGNYLF